MSKNGLIYDLFDLLRNSMSEVANKSSDMSQRELGLFTVMADNFPVSLNEEQPKP